jgi:ubiquitin-activating enzyme E1
MTAGKIIPAIASTTCSVTGLVCLEFYKLVAGKPVTSFRNSYVNLAVNNFSASEPNGPRRKVSVAYDKVMMGPVKVHPEGHSRWDKFVINEGRDLTLGELTAWLKAKHGLTLEMLLCEGITLYYPGMFPKQVKDRGGVGMFAHYQASRAAKVPPPAPMPDTRKYLVLELSVQNAEGVDVLLPTVQYYCRGW